MTQPTKFAVAVRSDLATWQKLNIVAFVTSGFGTLRPDLIGEPYLDASGQRYLPMLAHPVMVLTGDGPALQRAFSRSLARDLTIGIYTDDLFATTNDHDNRAAVAAVPTEAIVPAGFSVAGPPRDVDKAFDKLKLHD